MADCLTGDRMSCLDIPYDEQIKRSYSCIRTGWMTVGMKFDIPPYTVELKNFDEPNFPDHITYWVYKDNVKIGGDYAFLLSAKSYDNYNICVRYSGYKASPASAEFLIHYVPVKETVGIGAGTIVLGIAALILLGYLVTKKK